jgi:hypothetical protein
VAVAGNFSAVVEVVEHSELQRQFVLVGSDVFAIHGQRFVAVADGKVAKNLIVGAIFFQNVDHVADRDWFRRRIQTCRRQSERRLSSSTCRV